MKTGKSGKRAEKYTGRIMSTRIITVSFTLNGREVSCDIIPSLLLIDLLRDQFNLRGVKPGCREGECGACSVLVDGYAVNSCLFLAVNAGGKDIVTPEGLSPHAGIPDNVQKSLIENGAVQCGFCSPGMAIMIKSLENRVKEGSTFSKDDIKKNIDGNLCRCTGYIKIIKAVRQVLKNSG